jgi:predicted peptidase
MMKMTRECFSASKGGLKLPYLRFLPENYTGGGAVGYPLMIFLCGSGECGDDLDLVAKHGPPRFAKAGEDYPLILVSPQIPEGDLWFAHIETLNDWLDELIKTLPIDTSRIYLTGLSNGGIGTWLWGTHDPKRFAALVPVCGEGNETFSFMLTGVPIWAFHGDADPCVSCDCSRRLVEKINNAGGNAKLTVYPGVGHDSWEQAYREPELISWIMAQHRAGQ